MRNPASSTSAVLEAAGTDYPQSITDLYLGVADGQIGDNAKKLEARIKAESPSQTPFDLAQTMVKDLQNPANFTYKTDVRDLDCAAISTVECFATFKKGFCQYYAPTMAVLLRRDGGPDADGRGLPAGRGRPAHRHRDHPVQQRPRLGRGLLPGHRLVHVRPDRRQPVPGHPTAVGSTALERSPIWVAQELVLPSRNRDVGPGVLGNAGTPPSRGGPLGPLLAVGALLLIVVGLLAFVAWQRGPRGATSPEGAYGTVTRIASRFGFGPRPAQTVYEYAGSLGEILPDARPELETVARAKVESVYAQQILGDERIASLRAAQRRLRVSLLKLAFHRKERRRRR